MTDNVINIPQPEPITDPDLPEVIELSPYLEVKGFKRTCLDHHLVVDAEARQVTCSRCETTLDPIDALAYLARKEARWRKQYVALRQEIAELKAWSPFLKALRSLERIWRGRRMLPCCPHCHVGITAEALANSAQTSAADPHAWRKASERTIIRKD